MECIETLLKEMKKTSENLNKIADKIKIMNDDDWDWVSVRKGAELLYVSPQILYKKINEGKLEVRHIGNKKLIRLSQLKKIDDKEGEIDL